MARGINKVIIVGNLGSDPELKAMPSGDSVASFSVATSEGWKDKQTGELKERTEWHRVSIFGKLAEIANTYLRKGSKVYLEGKLRTEKWQDQQGQERYTTKVIVNDMQMLDPKDSKPGSYGSAPSADAKPMRNPDPSDNNFDDDIPF